MSCNPWSFNAGIDGSCTSNESNDNYCNRTSIKTSLDSEYCTIVSGRIMPEFRAVTRCCQPTSAFKPLVCKSEWGSYSINSTVSCPSNYFMAQCSFYGHNAAFNVRGFWINNDNECITYSQVAVYSVANCCQFLSTNQTLTIPTSNTLNLSISPTNTPSNTPFNTNTPSKTPTNSPSKSSTNIIIQTTKSSEFNTSSTLGQTEVIHFKTTLILVISISSSIVVFVICLCITVLLFVWIYYSQKNKSKIEPDSMKLSNNSINFDVVIPNSLKEDNPVILKVVQTEGKNSDTINNIELSDSEPEIIYQNNSSNFVVNTI